MSAASYVRDDILVHLEEPRLEQLTIEVERLGRGVHIVSPTHTTTISTTKRVDENTPLILLKAGDATAYVDKSVLPPVDLFELDRQFHEQEDAALRDDQAEHVRGMVIDEATSLAKMALPMTSILVLERIATILLSMLLGNVSIEHSAAILAASSLADVVVAQLATNLTAGLTVAVDTVCAQSFGAKQYTQLWLYAQAGLLAMVYCLPFITAILSNGAWICALLGQDAALARLASVFMKLSLVSLPLSISLGVIKSSMVAQGIVMPFVGASLAAHFVSLPVAYVLGYKTALGYAGIPLSNVVALAIQNALAVHALLTNAVFRDAWPGWQLAKAHALVAKLWPLGISSILMVVFQNVGFSITSILSGWLLDAATAIAAGSIAITWIKLSFMPLMALFAGGAVRVGNALGGGKPRRAMVASRVLLAAMLSVSLVCLAVCGTYAESFSHAFTTDRATAVAATRLIYTMLPMVPLMACVLAAQAIFRACAQQIVSAKINLVAMVIVGVPLGCLLGFGLAWDAAGLWAGQTLGLLLFTMVAFTWVSRLDWQLLAREARLHAHLHVEK